MRGILRAVGVLAAITLPAFYAFAEGATEAATAVAGSGTGLQALAAGLGLSLAVIGGALSQGKIGAAAMEGIARNPNAQSKMFVSMIIGLVLIESLVIYMLVIAFNLLP